MSKSNLSSLRLKKNLEKISYYLHQNQLEQKLPIKFLVLVSTINIYQ
jgi:hypothetical protein